MSRVSKIFYPVKSNFLNVYTGKRLIHYFVLKTQIPRFLTLLNFKIQTWVQRAVDSTRGPVANEHIVPKPTSFNQIDQPLSFNFKSFLHLPYRRELRSANISPPTGNPVLIQDIEPQQGASSARLPRQERGGNGRLLSAQSITTQLFYRKKV